MEVIYTGSTKEQRNFGHSTDNWDDLIVGKKYNVEKEEVHSWHTLFELEGVWGKFNSVCFKEAK